MSIVPYDPTKPETDPAIVALTNLAIETQRLDDELAAAQKRIAELEAQIIDPSWRTDMPSYNKSTEQWMAIVNQTNDKDPKDRRWQWTLGAHQGENTTNSPVGNLVFFYSQKDGRIPEFDTAQQAIKDLEEFAAALLGKEQ